MFRQILIHPDDADYQRILWRPSDDNTIRHYRLLTVTYGLASAPYLAMRVLRQLASDEGHKFPSASALLANSIYVDDILFGDNDMKRLRDSREQLIEMISRGGFSLRKWAANNTELLSDIPSEHRELVNLPLFVKDAFKVLSLSWLPQEDAFRFVVSSPDRPMNSSKRSILSFVSKLYDPLGWAAPHLC